MWKKCILIRASQGTSAERCGGLGRGWIRSIIVSMDERSGNSV